MYNELNIPDSTIYYTNMSYKLSQNYGLYDIITKSWIDLISSDAFSCKGEFERAKNIAFNTLGIFQQEYKEDTPFLTTIFNFWEGFTNGMKTMTLLCITIKKL